MLPPGINPTHLLSLHRLQPYEIIGPQPAIDWFGSLSWKHWSKPGWWVWFACAGLRVLSAPTLAQLIWLGSPQRERQAAVQPGVRRS